MRLAANLTFLFTELPMIDRFDAARRAGFQGVEVLFPYDLAARELAAECQAAGLEFLLLNSPPPNWAGGARGFAAVPGGEERFRRDFDRALRYAEVLRARHIHVMAGRAEGGAARDTFVKNLRWACERAPHASLMIEPISTDDVPGYFLGDFELAESVIDEVAAANLGLQFDVYHAQQISGDVFACWTKHAHHVRHVQVAGAPGRREPGSGDIDHSAFLQTLKTAGYRGWIGAEYVPRRTTEAGLSWMRTCI